MKKIFLLAALCALTMVANAGTYNYLCAITELTVDTLQSTSKNQFTLNWTQKCKNIAEYSSKPTGTYTTTVKLVLNSDDRTLEGTYTTEGASSTSSSANVNDQTINLVTSELYYGTTRRLLRTDSISTFTIIKIDDTHYGISVGRLCFTAAALADRGKHTYNYNYCYAEEEILVEGISPKPFIFGYDGEYHEAVYNYDMTVNGISVVRDDSDGGYKRYFLTLNCVGKNRDTNEERNYEVQLAIYPSSESIVGTFATQGTGNLLYSSYSYVKDLKVNKQRYLANDSLSTIQIKSKGTNQYSFYGGTLTCTDLDANYSSVYGKKRIEAVHYYHFSDNDGEGIPFGFDEDSKEVELTANSAAVETTVDGIEITLQAKDSNNVAYTVYVILDSETLAGTFTYNSGLSAWSKVGRGTNDSYITSGSTITINAKGNDVYTISGNLLCENEMTYILKPFDFSQVATGIEDVRSENAGAVRSEKILLDGQMYIFRGEKIFDAQGKQVK
jgi:hypothetical protein